MPYRGSAPVTRGSARAPAPRSRRSYRRACERRRRRRPWRRKLRRYFYFPPPRPSPPSRASPRRVHPHRRHVRHPRRGRWSGWIPRACASPPRRHPRYLTGRVTPRTNLFPYVLKRGGVALEREPAQGPSGRVSVHSCVWVGTPDGTPFFPDDLVRAVSFRWGYW